MNFIWNLPLFTIVLSLFSGPLISHTFTVTDHETGESATFSKDDVDVILKKKR